jgi:hypothetical protein
MTNSIRRRLTYANVTSTLALFVALGGSAAALTHINGSQIRNRSILGKKLNQHTITGTEVNVSSLGTVPHASDADRLGGNDSSAFLSSTGSAANAA